MKVVIKKQRYQIIQIRRVPLQVLHGLHQGQVWQVQRKRDRSDNVLDIMADSLQKNTAVQIEPVGKYSSYGKHITQELEDFLPTMAIYCKKIIHEAIYYAQLGSLSSQSKVVIEPQITLYLAPVGYDSVPPSEEAPSHNNIDLVNYYSHFSTTNNECPDV